jgi:prevent-host-death family protein
MRASIAPRPGCGYIYSHNSEWVVTTYSLADAKNGLPGLIDRALEGEEVIITRHGKAVAELRPIVRAGRKITAASYAWLQARRQKRKSIGITSVELLDQLYEDPQATEHIDNGLQGHGDPP